MNLIIYSIACNHNLLCHVPTFGLVYYTLHSASAVILPYTVEPHAGSQEDEERLLVYACLQIDALEYQTLFKLI